MTDDAAAAPSAPSANAELSTPPLSATAAPSRVERLEIDGVPVFWMPDARRSMAALQFRVGRSDEAFPDMGITHLVEHLAFFRLGRREHVNGFVDHVRTVFVVHDDPPRIAAFLREITEAIHDLPFDRLPDEARILRAEAISRTPSIFEQLLWLRFGSAAQGLVRMPEYGLSRIGAAGLRAWASTHFTAGNAAVWIAGPMPEGIRLELPAGPRMPVAMADPIPRLRLPAWTFGGIPGIALGLVIPREWSSTMGARIVTKRLEQRLRYELGRSYEVSLAYAPLGPDVGHASIYASCLDADAAEVRKAFLAVIDQFASKGPDETELVEDRASFAKSRDDPDSGFGELDRAVHDALLGVAYQTPEDHAAEHARVRAHEIQSAFRTDLDRGILIGPIGDAPHGLSARQWQHYPEWSDETLAGQRFDRVTKRFPWSKVAEQLVVGPDGVSWLGPQPQALTVRFADCVGLLIDTDGARIVHGRDGFRVVVRASEWKNGEAAVAAVDRAVPPELVIRPPPT